jgi:TIR domain
MGKEIFISHATKDKVIINDFVDLILHGGLSVSIDKIFCVSTDGTKIKSGEDWRNAIKENLISAKVNFLIITPNYKESEVCLNEMGASWVSDANIFPLIVEPINYKSVGVIYEPSQIEKLTDEKSLDRIRDIIQETLSIPITEIKSDRWTAKKTEFISKVEKYIIENPFKIPIDRNSFEELLIEKNNLKTTIKVLIDDKEKLKNEISELKKLKDKTEVSKVLLNLNNSTEFEKFEKYVSSLHIAFSKNSAIINGLIFRTYSNNDLTIEWNNNKKEIDNAIARNFIDDEFNIRWDETKEMRKFKEILDEFSTFLSISFDQDFYDIFDEEYDSPLDIRNLTFWENVIDVPISFD